MMEGGGVARQSGAEISRAELEAWLRAQDPVTEVGFVGASCLHPICEFLRSELPGWTFYLGGGDGEAPVLGGVGPAAGWFELGVGWVAAWDRHLRAAVAVELRRRLLAPVTAEAALAALALVG